MIGPLNAQHAARLVHRVTQLQDPDHVHELQLRPQLMRVPTGTPVWVDVLDIADLGRQIAAAVGDGKLTYQQLMRDLRCAEGGAARRGPRGRLPAGGRPEARGPPGR